MATTTRDDDGGGGPSSNIVPKTRMAAGGGPSSNILTTTTAAAAPDEAGSQENVTPMAATMASTTRNDISVGRPLPNVEMTTAKVVGSEPSYNVATTMTTAAAPKEAGSNNDEGLQRHQSPRWWRKNK